ncbi:hypothetical protein ALNOE001_04140 [Candidatus Methanobinarius endosymbioticus]|uniref:Uncharacterized protein n=1 Tax=Candidatus Methanobinarius endosymbioticus TaxID=2006182 RepID=A0A366MFE5_9EURY|nr:hypothetical protein ALNOE001_04140 [Candidatus Methanobinarius endosymbioticus]
MKNLKNLKSIDLLSTTIIGTSINLIWSIVFAIVLIVGLSSVIGRFDISFAIIGIGIVFGTIILSIAQYFGISFLYNFLIKKMKNIVVNMPGLDKITEVSVVPFSLMVAVISLIISISIYPLIFLALSFVSLLYPLLQAMSLQGLAWLVFPISLSFSPMFIVYAFIIGFVFTAIGTFIFNMISPKIGGLKLSLAADGKMTKIMSIDPKTTGMITGVICLIFGLIYGIIFSILTGNLPANLILIVILTIKGLIGGFIYGALSSVLYNFFSKKFTHVKLELEETE